MKRENNRGHRFARRSTLQQDGFTLTEVLLTTFILVVVLLGIAAIFPMGYTNIFNASEETKAAVLAQDMMEQIKKAPSFPDMLSFADAPPAGATSPTPNYITTLRDNWTARLASANQGLPGGNGTINIAVVGASPSRRATISVTVDWSGRKSAPGTLTTQICEDF